MIILIDNGHGIETPGKCSPDKQLKEYAYTREISNRVAQALCNQGINTLRIVPEETDIPLKERCKRINDIQKSSGGKAILLSIHCNASGIGKDWMPAHGWSAFVSGNASNQSKQLATCLVNAATEQKLIIRKPSLNQPYWMENFSICRDTSCPAVLTENLFQDNREDVAFLLSEKGKETITRIHVEGIICFLGITERLNLQ